MGKNFLGLDGLKHFWSKAKSWIAEQIAAEVTAKIAKIVAEAPENLDTLKEIADWISSHADDAAAMNSEIKANTEAISDKADKIHTHTKSQITDFPTSLPANGGTADYAKKIVPSYISKSIATVTSVTIKYIHLADCNWYDTGTLQVLLTGNNFQDTLVINFGGGNGLYPMLCGHYSGNNHRVYSVITQNGPYWNLGYSIYVKIGQETNLTMNVALLKGDCTINITEATTEPTNISEWPVSYGLFGDLTGGLIAPRQGTTDGNTVSIGRSDGNITIGATENNNAGYTTINNDCKMVHDLEVFGESNFVGPCFFNDDISVHNKSLFPSGYIPRTYFIERATKDNITAEQKELLRKMFAYQSVGRLIQCYGFLKYRFDTSGAYFGGTVVTVGYFDGDDWLDSNDNIIYDDNTSVNFACFGVQDDVDNINIVDMYIFSDQVMRNNFEILNYLLVNKLFFTVLEKV